MIYCSCFEKHHLAGGTPGFSLLSRQFRGRVKIRHQDYMMELLFKELKRLNALASSQLLL